MEQVRARPEACLLHGPLKWVDDDECVSFSEHSQTFSSVAFETENHLLNEDKLNDNLSRALSTADMVNGTVDGPELPSSTCNLTAEKHESKSDCEYCIALCQGFTIESKWLTSGIITDKILNRGISRATDNVNIVSRVRSELALVDNADEENSFIETPLYTFTLPDFSQYPGTVSSISDCNRHGRRTPEDWIC